MSRTYKDKPWKHRDDTWEKNWEWVAYEQADGCFMKFSNPTYIRYLPGVLKKKKKHFKEWGTNMYNRAPGWFTRQFMNRPARRKAHMLEQLCLNNPNLDDLDDFIVEDKEFVYYY